MEKYCLGLIFIFLLVFGCQKEPPELIADKVSLPVDGQVRCIFRADSLWLIGGGDKNESGFLLSTTNFNDFEVVSESFESPVYSMTFFQNRFVLGLDDAAIAYSDELQEFYDHYPEEEYWINTPLKQPLYQMLVTGETLVAAGGGEFQYGLILTSLAEEQHSQYAPHEYENAIRSVAEDATGRLWAVGNGIALRSENSGETWTPQAFDAAYLTSIAFDEDGRGLITTFGGDIYSTSNNGSDWSRISTGFEFQYMRRVATNGENGWVMTGNNGVVLTRKNGNWDLRRLGSEDDLHEVVFVNTDELVIGANGAIYRLGL